MARATGGVAGWGGGGDYIKNVLLIENGQSNGKEFTPKSLPVL